MNKDEKFKASVHGQLKADMDREFKTVRVMAFQEDKDEEVDRAGMVMVHALNTKASHPTHHWLCLFC